MAAHATRLLKEGSNKKVETKGEGGGANTNTCKNMGKRGQSVNKINKSCAVIQQQRVREKRKG